MRWLGVVVLGACGRIAFDPLTADVVDPEIVSRAGVAADGSMSCARRDDGSVWCWGTAELGQLGNGVEARRA